MKDYKTICGLFTGVAQCNDCAALMPFLGGPDDQIIGDNVEDGCIECQEYRPGGLSIVYLNETPMEVLLKYCRAVSKYHKLTVRVDGRMGVTYALSSDEAGLLTTGDYFDIKSRIDGIVRENGLNGGLDEEIDKYYYGEDD